LELCNQERCPSDRRDNFRRIMFTQGFGEVLTDILTVNPALAELPSASSILDTSNYTFNAVTYGKDAQGFNFHGHAIVNVATDVAGFIQTCNLGLLLLEAYNPDSAGSTSSYFFSSTYEKFSSTYNSVPQYPSPYDRRVEKNSTIPNALTASASLINNFSSIPDMGHYSNVAAGDPSISGLWNIVGGFPPSKYILPGYPTIAPNFVLGRNGAVTAVALSGVYNEFGLVDPSGFVKINETSGIDTGLSSLTNIQGGALSGGPCIYSGVAGVAVSSGEVTLAVVPQLGDAAALAAFGGVSHLGVWCLDLGEMLKQGLTPPYSWNPLNNNRKYKLVSKTTLWDNLLSHQDYSTYSGLVDGLALGLALANKGPLFTIKFTFT